MRTDLTPAMRETLILLLKREQGIQIPDLRHPTNQRLIRQGLHRRDLVTRSGCLTEEGRVTARELIAQEDS